MRHFLALTLAVSNLAGGMGEGAFGRALVNLTGPAQAVAAAIGGAALEAEDVAPVAIAAKPHQSAAAGAEVLPVVVSRRVV
jgi:hypothetical protein